MKNTTKNEIKFCKEFLKRQIHLKNTSNKTGTYGWKHIAEGLYSGGYISMSSFNGAARELGFKLKVNDNIDNCYINLDSRKVTFYSDIPSHTASDAEKRYVGLKFIPEVDWRECVKTSGFITLENFYLSKDKDPNLVFYKVTIKQFEDMKKDFDRWFDAQTEYKTKDFNAIDYGWLVERREGLKSV